MKRIFLWVLTLGLIGAVIFRVSAHKDNTAGVSLENNIPESNLKFDIDKILADTRGDYSIAVKNLRTGETYFRDEHKVYETGSLYKLWIMATAFGQIEEGLLKEDEVLSKSIASLNNVFGISSDSAELTSGVITLTVGSALQQMITISHNYAALLLTDKIKLSSVKTFLNKHELKESVVGVNGSAPVSTASDIAHFFEKLYKNELAGQVASDKMSTLLKNQQLNDKLPKYLPKEVIVAHKTGEVGWFSHDGGIVYTHNGDYIIVVLSESDFPQGAEEKMALISQAVYKYFENKTPPR